MATDWGVKTTCFAGLSCQIWIVANKSQNAVPVSAKSIVGKPNHSARANGSTQIRQPLKSLGPIGFFPVVSLTTKTMVVNPRRFRRVKDSSEIRRVLNLRKASGYKIHKLLAIPAGR